jgi:hypothetical protein
MGGKIKSSRPLRRAAVLRPVMAGWQRWEESEAEDWVLAGEASDLHGLSTGAGCVIAVPVRRAFSLAVWVSGEDPSLFGDLVYTQLEVRGLAGRSRELTTFAWHEIAREGHEVLLHAVVLPPHLAPDYWNGDVTEYAVSPACLPLVPDAVNVWEEAGGWVAAVTRVDKVVHFQPLTEPTPDASMALEIWLMLAPLEAGHMTSTQTGVRLYYQGDSAPDLADWRAGGRLPVEVSPLPAPVRPVKPLVCVPLPVREGQRAKQVSARRQRWAYLAAAVYFLVVLGLAANTLRLHWRAQSLAREVSSDAGPVAEVQATMNRWQALEPAVEPAGFPLEVLYQASGLLPKDGVRLTLFTMNLERLVIVGEASTLRAAQKFQEDVSKNPALAGFEWKADNPKTLPTGSTKFQIDGVRRGGAPGGENQFDESADL